MDTPRKQIKLSPDSDVIEPDILQAAHELLEISSSTSSESVPTTMTMPNPIAYELTLLIDAIKRADEIGNKIVSAIENITHWVVVRSLFAYVAEFISKPITALYELCKRRNNIDYPGTHFKLRIRMQGNSSNSNEIVRFVPLFIPTMDLHETIATYNVLIGKYHSIIRIMESIHGEISDDYRQLFNAREKQTYMKHCEVKAKILKDVCGKQRCGFILTTIFMKMIQNPAAST